MNNIIIITELLLFALGLSLCINSIHLAFGEGMIFGELIYWKNWQKFAGKPWGKAASRDF